MKKQTVLIFIALFVIILVVAFGIAQNVNAEREIAKYNSQFDSYLNKQIIGTEVTTIINKAINENEKNNVLKDEKNHYIPNETDSIKVYVKLEPDGDNFEMEKIFNFGITEFVKNFNLEDFKCTKVNYHKDTKKVSEVYFEVI